MQPSAIDILMRCLGIVCILAWIHFRVAFTCVQQIEEVFYVIMTVSGPCSVLTSGTLVLGYMAVRSDTVAGAVEPNDPANGPDENTNLGQVLVVNGDTDNSVINLNIE